MIIKMNLSFERIKNKIKLKRNELIRIFLLSLLAFIIILLGYGSFYLVVALIAFLLTFLTITLPLIYIKIKSNNEIDYEFFLMEHKKFSGNYNYEDIINLKSFPSWAFLSLLLSSLFLFKIPILFAGRIKYEGQMDPIKFVTEKNSEIRAIKNHLTLYLIIILFFSIFLMMLNPYLAIIPSILLITLILPIPNNLGYDLLYLDFKRWLILFNLFLAYFLSFWLIFLSQIIKFH